MDRIFKKILLGLCLLMLSAATAHAQIALQCNPQAPVGGAGSCQDPQGANLPGCYLCEGVIGGPPPACVAHDEFCDPISGGKVSNECRVGACTGTAQTKAANPSGCEYDLDTGASDICSLCASPAPVSFDSCGNGVCEPNLGEDCSSCDIDCLLPGFEDGCPAAQSILDAACVGKPITFGGPPYNNPDGNQLCEDGDICTDNVCVATDQCGPATAKGCEADADFCCPGGCAAPAPGGTCREVTGAPIPGCDPDCYVPVVCVPTPSPTPPPPPFVGCLEGSGVHGSSGGPGCKGFSCSLDPLMAANSAGLFGTSVLSLAALASCLLVRRRKR